MSSHFGGRNYPIRLIIYAIRIFISFIDESYRVKNFIYTIFTDVFIGNDNRRHTIFTEENIGS